MAKCDFCSIYDPDSECLAESCLIVRYGIAHKVKNDAAFNAQFGELNDILFHSINPASNGDHADNCSCYCFYRRF
ncbi:hypothetical protein KY284_010138 [Solanum tuberosum]|nr:hypothetical protein KY284_010138 [Solanum tuberosum]